MIISPHYVPLYYAAVTLVLATGAAYCARLAWPRALTRLLALLTWLASVAALAAWGSLTRASFPAAAVIYLGAYIAGVLVFAVVAGCLTRRTPAEVIRDLGPRDRDS